MAEAPNKTSCVIVSQPDIIHQLYQDPGIDPDLRCLLDLGIQRGSELMAENDQLRAEICYIRQECDALFDRAEELMDLNLQLKQHLYRIPFSYRGT